MKWIESFKEFIRSSRNSAYGWSGDYSNWQEAERLCSGYASVNILEKVKQSILRVKNNEAVYERDSVLFDSIEYSWPLLSGMMWIAAQNKGSLNIADFGGSLGSSYFQNRIFLDQLSSVRWNIIEQNNFVECGKKYLQNHVLHFFNSVEQCIAANGLPELLLLSCVLPYLDQPYTTLRKLMEFQFPYIIIDNTYFNYENRDRICIQKVPPDIYEASYPCWLLDYDKVIDCLLNEYGIVTPHVNSSVIYLDGKKIAYKGVLVKKNK